MPDPGSDNFMAATDSPTLLGSSCASISDVFNVLTPVCGVPFFVSQGIVQNEGK